MPKTKTAQSYVIESIQVSVDDTNQITSYLVQVNVAWAESVDAEGNLINQVNARESYDLWPVASTAQKAQAQAIQNLIKPYLDGQILG